MADSSERPGLFRRLLSGGSSEEKVRTARYPLQAYGKLPIYKDFISVGLTDPAAKEFRQWLDRGFSRKWAVDEQYRETEIPAHGFLLRLPESRASVAGALWGSSDEGGLRKFPFTVFLSLPAGQPAADPLAAVHYLVPFERRCEEIRDGYAAGASLAAFYKAYRGAEFECAVKTREQVYRELKSAIGDFLVSEFAESLFGPRAAARWPAFLASLEDAAGQASGPGAIRLPLSGVLPRSREITMWLRWLDRLDGKRRRPVTGVLYTSGRGPGRAVLFFRDLGPEDFLLLHPTLQGQTKVQDVGAPEAEAPAPPPVEPPAAQVQPPSAPVETIPAAVVDSAPAPIDPHPVQEASAAPAVAGPSLESAVPESSEGAAEPSANVPPAAVSSEPLPFPEAAAQQEPAAVAPRETFSALVVPVVGEPPGGASARTATEPIVVESPPPPAAHSAPATPPEVPAPAGWNRPLCGLLGL
jgi:type VI secretion system ImpM family protein